MTKRDADKLAEALRKTGGAYDVGFGKAPEEHRFKPGESGNPTGRPLGSKNKSSSSKNLRTLILEEAKRDVSVMIEGSKQSLPMARVIVRSLLAKAAKGDVRAQERALRLIDKAQLDERADNESLFESVINYRFTWNQEFKRRLENDIYEPMWRPYAHHLECDINGDVWALGPLTEKEAALEEKVKELKVSSEAQLKRLEGMLSRWPNSMRVGRLREICRTLEDIIAKSGAYEELMKRRLLTNKF